MDALDYNQQQKSLSLEWWDRLSIKEKIVLSEKHYPDLNPFLLTVTKIEKIFKLETHG